jgi:amidophosphoribosyltransferase
MQQMKDTPFFRHPFDDDKLREECGVYGIFGTQDAAAHTALGLHALQHRGQEGVGILSNEGDNFHVHRALGLVGDNFSENEVIEGLPGNAAIGHVRYSTAGGTFVRNIQPLFAEYWSGGFGVCHNGNLTNAKTLRRHLIKQGAIFQSSSDTEVIIHLIAQSSYPGFLDRFIDALKQIEGAYSLVALTSKALIGARDPLGVRPLVLGQSEDGAHILASETCALDIIGAKYVRDIQPGEIVYITDKGITSMSPFPKQKERFCIFEHVYFSRPDSFVNQLGIYDVRKRIGAELAKESPAEADIVVAVPDSGNPAALGYAQASGLPFEMGIIRNHYIGRTFIEPADHIRHLGVKLKHNANPEQIKGKRVVLVDDSIVRGTTSVKIIDMVRAAGAKEVHMRIASPPTTNSCFYGVNTPTREELLASKKNVDEMCEYIGADSLAFVSIDGLYRAVYEKNRNAKDPKYCDACFTGDYATPLTDQNLEEDGRQLSLISVKKHLSPGPPVAWAVRSPWSWPKMGLTSSRWPNAARVWKALMMKSGTLGARPPLCRWICRKWMAWMNWAWPFMNAGKNWIF